MTSYDARKRKGMLAPEGGSLKLPFDGSALGDPGWAPVAGDVVVFRAEGLAVREVRKK